MNTTAWRGRRWALLFAGVACGSEPSVAPHDSGPAHSSASSVPPDPATTHDPSTTSGAPPYTVCSQPPDMSTAATASWAVVEPMFDGCVSCHRSNPTGLTFSNPYNELVDVPSAQAPGRDRIEPGDLQGSYLWHKLCGTQKEVGGSGGTMPVTGELTEGQVVDLATWILAGAAP